GGGQTEIVEHSVSGFLFDAPQELLDRTLSLMEDNGKAAELAGAAYERGQAFTREVFTQRVREHFGCLLREYRFEETAGD
ncbi:MAG: glycosyltransferase, partial [Candidatus Aminicenantaceae bacterium]